MPMMAPNINAALEKILLLATVDTKVYLLHGVAPRQDA
jgi:hypothetical protein